jgi:hypothetical protein
MTAQITIKARDLDTDTKRVATIEVAPAWEPEEQRLQLARVVEEHHPGARLRSFADGAATFLDREHLIVASYSTLPPRPRAAKVLETSAQEPLFAR